jgi:hypothetical protein
MGVRERAALPHQPVHVRRVYRRIAQRVNRVKALIVRQKKHNVRSGDMHLQPPVKRESQDPDTGHSITFSMQLFSLISLSRSHETTKAHPIQPQITRTSC